jgi:hypothetical protein
LLSQVRNGFSIILNQTKKAVFLSYNQVQEKPQLGGAALPQQQFQENSVPRQRNYNSSGRFIVVADESLQRQVVGSSILNELVVVNFILDEA